MNVHDRHFIHDTGSDDHDDIFHLLFNFSFITRVLNVFIVFNVFSVFDAIVGVRFPDPTLNLATKL